MLTEQTTDTARTERANGFAGFDEPDGFDDFAGFDDTTRRFDSAPPPPPEPAAPPRGRRPEPGTWLTAFLNGSEGMDGPNGPDAPDPVTDSTPWKDDEQP